MEIQHNIRKSFFGSCFSHLSGFVHPLANQYIGLGLHFVNKKHPER